jgi:hypothetical protein
LAPAGGSLSTAIYFLITGAQAKQSASMGIMQAAAPKDFYA